VKNQTANSGLTWQRRTPRPDTDTYGDFARRIVRAYGRRVATGDVEALAGLIALTGELDASIQHAVDGLRAFGYSWADIASRLGVSRQGVWQRWGPDHDYRRTSRAPGASRTHAVDGQMDLFAPMPANAMRRGCRDTAGGPDP
jgi:hypothetical protein